MQAIAEPTSGALVRESRRSLWLAIALAAILRLMIAVFGIGTNDIEYWMHFGRAAWLSSFYDLWRENWWMNHPPAPVAWAAITYGLAGESMYAFSVIFKSPGIVADLVSVALIYSMVRFRTQHVRAAAVAAFLFAVNPTMVLITGYHGNTDPVLAMLSLATWALADRGRLGFAALALAASINIKLAPAPTVLLLLACVRTVPQLKRVLVGLAVGTLPFIWMTAKLGTVFLGKTLLYRPPGFSWLVAFIWEYRGSPTFGGFAMWLCEAHRATLTQFVLIGVILLAWGVRQSRGTPSPLLAGTRYWTCFLLYAGGAFQYAVWAIPLLAATRPAWAFVFGIGCGAWICAGYYVSCVQQWPFISRFELHTPDQWKWMLTLPLFTLAGATLSLFRRQKQISLSDQSRSNS